jgi:hypothetical protein
MNLLDMSIIVITICFIIVSLSEIKEKYKKIKLLVFKEG